jgi:type IV pilus assembly protein PilV
VNTVTAADRRRLRGERGFTLIEVLVAAMVLIVGLLALLGIMDVASHATDTNRVRQAATNVAREVVENVRSLSYTQLATTSGIASALQPLLTPGATLSGSTLQVTRGSTGTTAAASNSLYTFNVTFTTCSLDDPGDGYGDHSSAPASGGSWCPDVAASGSTDSNPDDYKRISVTVTPTGNGSAAHVSPVQQTVAIYARAVNGPAVSCLTTSSCPGTNPPPIISGNAQTFTVTTTSLAYEIQWLVNGNPPGAQDATGANGTYTPAGTTSSFTWTLPQADGIYSISAVGYDPNGNAGTRSTLLVTVNRHPVIPPGASSWGVNPASGAFNAGFDQRIGAVDVQWNPSIDQDVLYYNVYRSINGAAATLVCSHVTGTTCTDTTAQAPPNPANCTYQQSYGTTSVYYVDGWDTDSSTNIPRESTATSTKIDANLCDNPPSTPSNLAGTLNNGALNLSWTAPAYPGDPDSGDYIQAWRIYRWPASQGPTPQLTVGNRLQLVGAGTGSSFVTTATDGSPDPGGVVQDYCVTAVDTHLNESPCSNVLTQ